jgi:hypothetical protein
VSELVPLYRLESCKFGKVAAVTKAVMAESYVLAAVDYNLYTKLCFLLFKRKPIQN